MYAGAAVGSGWHREAPHLSKLTGERPLEGHTPDSLLALHEAGYREVRSRLGPGRVLDVGCGQGFSTVELADESRSVVGVDYEPSALVEAAAVFGDRGLRLMACDALALSVGDATFDWVCSSHVIEHFVEPAGHVAELARVLRPSGTAFVVTPNAPADFENPFHVHLFEPDQLADSLGEHFAEVWVGGLDATAAVKADLAKRRAKAARLLRLDVFDLRHRLPRSWYVAAYTRLLPLAYRVLARDDGQGHSGIEADDFFMNESIDETVPVLFAIARRPRRPGA